MRMFTPLRRSPASKETLENAVAAELLIKNERYGFPGYEESLRGGYVFTLSPARPHSEKKDSGTAIPRDTAAHIADWNLWWLCKADAALCLMMGEAMAEVNAVGFIKLGYVGLRDFCREELGFSGRLGYQLIQIAAMLQKFPLLREAHVKGKINRSALRHLLQVVEPETEASWVRIAGMLTVRALEDKVKSWKKLLSGEAEENDECLRELFGEDISDLESLGLRVKEGGAPDCFVIEEGEKGRWVSVKVPLSQAKEWDFARETFQMLSETDLPTSEFIEALLAESLAGGPLGEWMEELPLGGWGGRLDGLNLHAGEEEDSRKPSKKAKACGKSSCSGQSFLDAFYSNSDESRRSFWRETQVALEGLSDYWSFLPWKPVTVIVPEELKRDDKWKGNPHLIAQKLKEMQQLRHRIAFHQGRLLGHMWKHWLCNELMFVNISFYARERHGMSSSTVRARITMDKRFRDHPLLEKEFLRGVLSLEQARLLGETFECGTELEEDWIDYAKVVPVADLRRTVEKLQDMSEIKRMKWRSLSPWKLHRSRRYDIPQMCSQSHQLLPGERSIGKTASKELQMCAQVTCAEAGEATTGGVIEACRGMCEKCPASNPPESDARVTIRFFLRDDLKKLWDLAEERYFSHCEAGLADEHSQFRSGPPGLSDFLGALVRGFLKTWVYQHAIYPEKVTFRKRIARRDGCKCSVPGCTCRKNLHVHHIIFRSHGGTDIEMLCITLCESHHLRGVHDGYIIIEGTAPDGLTFLLGYRSGGAPFARFVNGKRVLPPLHTPVAGSGFPGSWD